MIRGNVFGIVLILVRGWVDSTQFFFVFFFFNYFTCSGSAIEVLIIRYIQTMYI
jgi:hypothetical protein